MPKNPILMKHKILALAPKYVGPFMAAGLGDAEARNALCSILALSPRRETRIIGAMAVVPVHGILDANDSFFGTNLFDLTNEILELGRSDAINTIVLDINSPGGTVQGTMEAAEAFYDIRKNGKSTFALVTPMAASAAFWIASQANRIYATSSAEVGSVGVVAVHEDVSGLMEKIGVKISIVKAGKFKWEENPFEPLSDEARANIQSDVDFYYKKFITTVARGRLFTPEAIERDFGQGRMMTAEKAVKEEIIDGTTWDMDDMLLAIARDSEIARIAIGKRDFAKRREARRLRRVKMGL